MAYLVLDAGTGSGKCLIFDQRGVLLGGHVEPWSYEMRAHPELEMVKEYSFAAPRFWATLCHCIREALRISAVAPRDIVGVSATSQREGCVFLDARGAEIYAGPNIDARGFMEGLEILERLGADRLHRITGHSVPFIFPLARYLWFRRHGSGQVAHLLMINDWMVYRLSGELAGEPSNATESMLFDFEARAWSEEILREFDVPVDILPTVHASGARVGAISSTAASDTGLLAGTPVHVGGADTQCSLLGSGVFAGGQFAATLGTTSPVQTVLDVATFDPQANLWAGCHVVPGRWVLESNAGDTGDAFLWLLELIGGGAPRAQLFQLADECMARAQNAPAMLFIGPSVFNLSRMNLQRPGGVLFPFPASHVRPDRAALVRGFMENVGFAIRGNLEQLGEVSGQRPRQLMLSGGMTRSRSLVRTIADVTGLPLAVAVEPESAGLGCAALMAASGARDDVSEIAAAMVRHEHLDPEPESHAAYHLPYRKWRELDDLLDRTMLS